MKHISDWKKLVPEKKKLYTISNCSECSIKHTKLQQAFPGKPFFKAEPSITLSLPENAHPEKEEVGVVLADLNKQWNDRHGQQCTSQNGPKSTRTINT